MEFLSNAIFSEVDQSMLGVVITSYDPEVYTSRCHSRLYSKDEFTLYYPKMQPRGFMVDENGSLLSDSKMIKKMATSVFSYMEHECANFGEKAPDITDLVLLGVDKKGFVLQGFKSAEEYGTPVSFTSFQVSNSSFNIYAPYKNDEGKFRTVSLLNLEDGGARELFVAMPPDVLLGHFGSCVSAETACVINGDDYLVYRVNLGLSPYYTEVGEAFLNFLSYQVAFYNLGESVLNSYKGMKSIQKMNLGGEEEAVVRPRRKAKVNVAIEHMYKDTKLSLLMELANKGEIDTFNRLVSQDPEARISWYWVQQIYNSDWFKQACDKGEDSDAEYIAAVNLLPNCRQWRLKFALELLTQRYYLGLLGLTGDYTGLILKGGGVDGESLKRVDFGNS